MPDHYYPYYNHPVNENRTYIYRIRRKEDGLFLCHLGSGTPHNHDNCSGQWGPTGVFWKKEETVRRHLLELCQFRVYVGNGSVHRHHNRQGPRQKADVASKPFKVIYPFGTPIHHVKTVYEWLDKYEVVGTEITVHGHNVVEARDFASFSPLEELNAR